MNDIFWIGSTDAKALPSLAIVSRPRGGDWLEDELLRIKTTGIRTVVSMLEQSEVVELGLAQEGLLAQKMGMGFYSHPIPDRATPKDVTMFRDFIATLANRARTGEPLGFHCRSCIGRATIAAACTLVHFGWTPGAALEAIETARGRPVPDTEEQRQWIFRYRAAE